MTPAMTGVVIHPNAIPPNNLKLILYIPLYIPIPIIQPTITCELDTATIGIGGRPILVKKFDKLVDEKMKSTNDCAKVTTSAASVVKSNKLFPNVFITFFE